MTLNFPRSSLCFANKGPASGDLFSSSWVGNGALSEERTCGDVCGGSWEHFGVEANLMNYLHDDILDILPSDPFGIGSCNSVCSTRSSASPEDDHDYIFSDSDLDMDLETAALTVAGWMEDFEDKSEGDLDGIVQVGSMIFGGHGPDVTEEDYQLFAGLNLFWSNVVRFQNSFPEYTAGNTNPSTQGLGNLVIEEFCDDGSDGLRRLNLAEENELFYGERYRTENMEVECQTTDPGECSSSSCGGESGNDGGDPHEAIFFALRCLGLKDLLSMSSVCRSLRHAVQSDPLLWRQIHIDYPLNKSLTDDILISLANKAQGGLQCLTLLQCFGITAAGLKYVLESNPSLTKLSILGCVLTIEGIIDNLKSFRSISGHGLRKLRLGDRYGVTHKHYEELLALLDADTHATRVHKPQHYNSGDCLISHYDDRLIDVEVCPRCENVRLVYDCPAEGCRLKPPTATDACRACTFCISRCGRCGGCVKDGEYEETFSLDLLCFRCWGPGCSLMNLQLKKVATVSL